MHSMLKILTFAFVKYINQQNIQMKKFFKKAFVMLGIAGMGLGTTSCDSETIEALLPVLTEIIGNVFNNGTTNVYQGTYSLQHLTTDGKGAYTLDSDKLVFNGTGITVTKTNQNMVNLVLPGTDGIGDATMTDVTIGNLEFVTDKSGAVTNQIDLGDNSTIDGTLTVGNKTYTASNLYIKCTLTADKLTITEASIYFGDNAEMAINVTFSGNIVTESAQ